MMCSWCVADVVVRRWTLQQTKLIAGSWGDVGCDFVDLDADVIQCLCRYCDVLCLPLGQVVLCSTAISILQDTGNGVGQVVQDALRVALWFTCLPSINTCGSKLSAPYSGLILLKSRLNYVWTIGNEHMSINVLAHMDKLKPIAAHVTLCLTCCPSVIQRRRCWTRYAPPKGLEPKRYHLAWLWQNLATIFIFWSL